MSFHSGRWINKTRKIHSCCWCGKRIEVGSAASYAAGVFEGDFWSGHYHPECQAAQDSMSYSDLMDGWCPGDFARGRTDDEFNLPPIFSPDYRGKTQLEAVK